MKDRHICDKCNKLFRSNYILQKHINRKVSCKELSKCVKCHKVFTNAQNMERHLNRKTPCIKKPVSNTENIEDIEDKRHRLSLELLDKKHQQKLELLKLKQSKPQIINNTQNNIQINISPPSIQTYDESIETSLNFYNKYIKTLSLDSFDTMISTCNNLKEVMIFVIKYMYNNSNFPEYKNVIYITDSDKFYSLKDMNWKEIKFEELYPTLHNILIKTFSNFGDKGMENDNCIATTHFLNMSSYSRVYNGKMTKTKILNHKKEIKDCAEEALDF